MSENETEDKTPVEAKAKEKYQPTKEQEAFVHETVPLSAGDKKMLTGLYILAAVTILLAVVIAIVGL